LICTIELDDYVHIRWHLDGIPRLRMRIRAQTRENAEYNDEKMY